MRFDLVILAGGFGDRMLGVTRGSKATLQIAGEAIVKRLTRQLAQFVCSTVVVTNEAHHEELLALMAGDASVISNGATCSDERLGAVADAKLGVAALSGSRCVLIAACDNVFSDRDAVTFANAASTALDADSALAALACREIPASDVSRFGIVTMTPDGDRISSFVEKPASSESRTAALGLYALSRVAVTVLSGMRTTSTDNMGLIMRELTRRGECVGIMCLDAWHDIGTPSALDAARSENGNS